MSLFNAKNSVRCAVWGFIFLNSVVLGLTITTTDDASVLTAAALLSDSSISVVGSTYVGNALAAGTYVAGPLGIGNGIILSTGHVSDATNPPLLNNPSSANGEPGSPLCDAIKAGSQDAAVLSFSITSTAAIDGITFEVIFATAEYPTFVGSAFSDTFVIYVDGVQVAEDPNGNPITLNGGFFSSANVITPPASGTTYGGSTPLLMGSAPLTPGPHLIQVAICDTSDMNLDSTALVQFKACVGDCSGGLVIVSSSIEPSTSPAPSTEFTSEPSTSSVQEGTTSTIPEAETTSTIPEAETTSTIPEAETTSTIPEAETTSTIPEIGTTIASTTDLGSVPLTSSTSEATVAPITGVETTETAQTLEPEPSSTTEVVSPGTPSSKPIVIGIEIVIFVEYVVNIVIVLGVTTTTTSCISSTATNPIYDVLVPGSPCYVCALEKQGKTCPTDSTLTVFTTIYPSSALASPCPAIYKLCPTCPTSTLPDVPQPRTSNTSINGAVKQTPVASEADRGGVQFAPASDTTTQSPTTLVMFTSDGREGSPKMTGRLWVLFVCFTFSILFC